MKFACSLKIAEPRELFEADLAAFTAIQVFYVVYNRRVRENGSEFSRDRL